MGYSRETFYPKTQALNNAEQILNYLLHQFLRAKLRSNSIKLTFNNVP